MRSRKSRGVPEWSGGKELYIGSAVSAIGKVSGSPGIVPGPPEGSRGSTGWGHLSRRAPWAEEAREPFPSVLGAPPWASPHAPRVGNPRVGGGHLHLPWGASHPLGRRPSLEIQSPRGAAAKGGTCPPSQVGRPPPLGFPTLGAGGGPWGAHQPTRGWFPSHFIPRGPPG